MRFGLRGKCVNCLRIVYEVDVFLCNMTFFCEKRKWLSGLGECLDIKKG